MTLRRRATAPAGRREASAPVVRGYDDKCLDALTANLDDLVAASGADTSTDAKAVEATGARDGEVDPLRRDYAEFRDTARPLLRPFPELVRRIGL